MLTEEHFSKLQVALGELALAADLPAEIEHCLECLRLNWDWLGNEGQVDAYLADRSAKRDQDEKVQLEADLAAVNARLGD